MTPEFQRCLEKRKIVALEHLYIEKGLIEKGIIESFTLGKEMRESADYRSSFSLCR